MSRVPNDSETPTQKRIWALLVELRRHSRRAVLPDSGCGLRLDGAGRLEIVPKEQAWVYRDPSKDPALKLCDAAYGGASATADAGARARADSAANTSIDAGARDMLELYGPFCASGVKTSFVVGHLGQSIDGQIATQSGASRYITGPENLCHMHRLRALSDAVLVGAATVLHDNPQLTTRLVDGDSPVRVVLDPKLTLPADRTLFQDRSAKTLVFAGEGQASKANLPAHVEIIEVAWLNGALSVDGIVGTLARRNLTRLFVEGGGKTVSRFLRARAFDRLHVTISPVLIGSGRPGISLPGVERLTDALRPPVRRFDCGQDVLFDFSFEA